MCGIFGYIGSIPETLAKSCVDTLAHRGPDGSGLWSTPEVTFGHRRLSILDLSDHAKQPMRSASDRYVLTFNGEIYNFLELRTELQSLGCRFHTDSDTEVILAAFEAWGEDCQHRFNGMWAFAIWDTHNKSLFLSRDRFGKKPLYYAKSAQGDFVFASEMKALFSLLKEVRANTSLVKDATRMFRYESTAECVVDGISRFPAGHSGWLKQRELTIKRWWCTLDHLPAISEKYEDQVEQFRELFLDACKLRMRSDVPLGTALSGGLDSSATISCMAHLAKDHADMRMNDSWQHAFVASFPNTVLDETKFARMVTDHIGIEPVIVEIKPEEAIASLNEYFYKFEDLYITSPIPFMQTYAAVKQNGVSVTLDGHGADELFGGYTFDYVHALADAGWNYDQASRILDAYFSADDNPQFGVLPSRQVFFAKWHAKRLIKKLIGRRNPEQSTDSEHPNWGKLDALNRQLYVSTHQTVLPTLLRNYDRYSMANGVEIRMPFMDHRIVSFAFALPWTSKIRNGFSKAIVRDAISPYMPDAITYRKTKIGFNSPVVEWMKGPLKEFMLDTINSKGFKESEIINGKSVAEQVRNVINNKNATFSDGEAAWTSLVPYLWERAVIKRERIL